jgi:hypothetical protein
MVAVASLISVAALLNAVAAFTCAKPGGAVGRFVDSLAVIGTNADAVVDSVRASRASAAEESLKVLSNEIRAVSTAVLRWRSTAVSRAVSVSILSMPSGTVPLL